MGEIIQGGLVVGLFVSWEINTFVCAVVVVVVLFRFLPFSTFYSLLRVLTLRIKVCFLSFIYLNAFKRPPLKLLCSLSFP